MHLREELDRRLAKHKDSPQLAEVVPQLLQMIHEEQLSPQTPGNLGFLSVAEGVIAKRFSKRR